MSVWNGFVSMLVWFCAIRLEVWHRARIGIGCYSWLFWMPKKLTLIRKQVALNLQPKRIHKISSHPWYSNTKIQVNNEHKVSYYERYMWQQSALPHVDTGCFHLQTKSVPAFLKKYLFQWTVPKSINIYVAFLTSWLRHNNHVEELKVLEVRCPRQRTLH